MISDEGDFRLTCFEAWHMAAEDGLLEQSKRRADCFKEQRVAKRQRTAQTGQNWGGEETAADEWENEWENWAATEAADVEPGGEDTAADGSLGGEETAADEAPGGKETAETQDTQANAEAAAEVPGGEDTETAPGNGN